jgi:hypothetical protein
MQGQGGVPLPSSSVNAIRASELPSPKKTLVALWYDTDVRPASIMASATPFCFCTTQKHLSAKIVIISMAYGIISPTPL